ncbi:PilZ domain-containing protein [Undibacterium sp. Di24W]|uniref:PilZ domain-containing protein n=1 Tax=Undibacterium sp. Di24W TaxID=3413033 RepID=UPI003BF0C70B
MTHDVENRKFERSSFFLVQIERDFLPIWVFQPHDDSAGLLGVLVDASEGGLQILLQKNILVVGQQFEMFIINQIGGDDLPLPPAHIQLVWSEDIANTYTKCGFTFQSYSRGEIHQLHAQAHSGEHKFLRCVLREVEQVTLSIEQD